MSNSSYSNAVGSLRKMTWLATAFASLLLSTAAVGQELVEEAASEVMLRLPPTVEPASAEIVALPEDAPAVELTLENLQQLALANNPTLVEARCQINAAQGRYVQAGLYPNPMIGYMGSEIGSQDTAGMQGGFVSQQFRTGGKLRLDEEVASQEIRRRRFEYSAQELRVLNDVKVRYFDSLAAKRQLDLSRELSDISRKLADSSRRLLEARQLSENDLLQAEIEAEETTILALNAENRHAEAWRRLTAVIGLPTLESTPLAGQLAGDLPQYEWESCYLRTLAASPEIGAAQAQISGARLAIDRARRENIPDVTAMVSVSRENQTQSDVAGAQVGLPIPLLNRNQGNIMTAEAELCRACKNLERLKLQLQERLAESFRRYADARQQASRYESEILPRSERSLALVERGYREGQVDYLTLLTSQRTYIRVNIAYVEALAELRRSTTALDGLLLEGSLRGE